jgi:hypothetical protein
MCPGCYLLDDIHIDFSSFHGAPAITSDVPHPMNVKYRSHPHVQEPMQVNKPTTPTIS